MRISNSIKKAKLSMKDTVTDYMTNIITVNQYSISVASLSAPKLIYPFTDYDSYVTQLMAVKNDAMVFNDTLFLPLQNLPGEILSYNELFIEGINEAIADANALIMNPSSKFKKADLISTLGILLDRVTSYKTQANNLYNNLVNYSTDLPEQSAQLKALADKAYNEEQVDKDKVSAITADIKALKQEIKDLTGAIIALAIVDAACITLGAIAVIVAGPYGLIAWIFLGAAVAVATTYIAIDSMKIKADKAKIEADTQQINGYTQDAAVLETQAGECQDLSDCAIAVQSNLTALINIWSEIETALTDTLEELKAAQEDTGSAYYQEVVDDLNASLDEWNALVQILTPLQISVNANNANLVLGMSSSSVEYAVVNAQTTDLQTYLNNLNSVA